jgi:hypothetical protein
MTHSHENDVTVEEMPFSLGIPGQLEVKRINGRYGLFPVVWLACPLGRFRVLDSWIEALDAGEYNGEFQVSEISLYTYKQYGEQRTCLAAKIIDYHLDGYDENAVPETELEQDPLENEAETVNPETVRNPPRFAEDQDAQIMLLRSFDDNWQFGDDYKIDKTLPRVDIIACRNALKALNYSFEVGTQSYRLTLEN